MPGPAAVSIFGIVSQMTVVDAEFINERRHDVDVTQRRLRWHSDAGKVGGSRTKRTSGEGHGHIFYPWADANLFGDVKCVNDVRWYPTEHLAEIFQCEALAKDKDGLSFNVI